ncbi:MAG: hypothetical protein MZV63_66195 [Marinilabiliales bacterium]|nr:hypothetical protein [Marinilabiliales bacterium]
MRGGRMCRLPRERRASGRRDRAVESLNGSCRSSPGSSFPSSIRACVWAVRRVFDFRERILAWQVWLDPDFVRTKPDEFVLAFFCGHEAVGREYADEIARGDMRALRAAFPALYPVFGLEDAFLKALFKAEIDTADYRAIVVAFASRTAKAVEDIRPAAADPEFWKALYFAAAEAASLGLHLLKDEDVQNMIVALVKKPAGAAPAIPPTPKMGDMIPISYFSARTRSAIVAIGLAAALSAACLTNLHRAKRDYAAGQEHAAAMRTEQAVASWKKAADVAGGASLRRPSAQSYTLKGLAEANLGRWREAEASFLKAFRLGLRQGRVLGRRRRPGRPGGFVRRVRARSPRPEDVRSAPGPVRLPAGAHVRGRKADGPRPGRGPGARAPGQGPGALRAEQGPRPAHRPRLRLRPLPLPPRPGRRPSRRPAPLVRGGGHGPRARPPRGKDPA